MSTQEIQQRRNANTHALGIASSHSVSKDSETSADQVKRSEEGRSTCVWKHKNPVDGVKDRRWGVQALRHCTCKEVKSSNLSKQ